MVPLAAALPAQQPKNCGVTEPVEIHVDRGHPWRPPYGLGRIGAPAVVHVQITGGLCGEYEVLAYRKGSEIGRQSLHWARGQVAAGKPTYFGVVQFAKDIDAVALFALLPSGRLKELQHVSVTWPDVEADAEARPDHQVNPIDLGTILVPHHWLLLSNHQTAVIEFEAISHLQDSPDALLRAWFTGGKPVEAVVPLVAGRRARQELQLALTSGADSTELHLTLAAEGRELWKKDIHTMVVAEPPDWPAFGAVETKLRYDAPISVKDPKTGAALPSIDYQTAWDTKLNDVVVFLPNGERFVFWRGASYAPFWAGLYNTGFSYQWAETIPPPGFVDAVEPLQDKELRYGRASILESTPSRVHVRWTYQSVDFEYHSVGDEAAEDFYFYPDGFGTRVVTLATTRPNDYEYSEFIVLLPQNTYPFEVSPAPTVEMLFLDGKKTQVSYPMLPGKYKGLSVPLPSERPAARDPHLHLVEQVLGQAFEYQREQGHKVTPADIAGVNSVLGKITHSRHLPILYRVFANKQDRVPVIYFSPSIADSTIVFLPFRDHGEVVTPSYWGDHWPLGRGALTGGAIDERIHVSPSHFSLMDLSEPEPLSTTHTQMLDTFGQSRAMTVERRVWLIAKTNAPDAVLLDWAHAFSDPPSIDVRGARIDFPSYSPERRAIRLIVQSPSIDIDLKPVVRTMNPVFELSQAPKELVGVVLDGKEVAPSDYRWDGKTLWVKAAIDAAGASIGIRFR